MAHKYSDKELKEATQIAYLSFLETANDNLIADGKEDASSIKELLYSYIDVNSVKNELISEGMDEQEITTQDIIQKSSLSDSDKSILERFSNDMFDWKIEDIHDMNDVNGMYGCVIETSDDQAIVAFRGSENKKVYSNLVNDWIKADFGLLNSSQTEQQAEVERYANELNNTKLLNKYKSIAVTGHSLGGNLANHFTIACAQDHRSNIFNKIDQSVNFDGPGVSDEYLEKYKEEIEKAAPKMQNYRWSAVGNLLFDIPGVENKNLDINKDLSGKSLKERICYKLLGRHDTKSLVFDESGNAKEGKKDLFAKSLSKVSKSVDKHIPYEVTHEIFMLGSKVFKNFVYEKENGKVGFKLPFTGNKKDKQVLKNEKACTSLLNDVVTNLKKGALSLENETRRELGYAGAKVGCSDVICATAYDNEYNSQDIYNFVNAIEKDKNDLNMEKAEGKSEER